MEFSCMAQWRPLTVRQVLYTSVLLDKNVCDSHSLRTNCILHNSFIPSQVFYFPAFHSRRLLPSLTQTFSEAISPLTEEVKKYSSHDYIMFCVKFMLEKVYCDPVSWNLSLRGVLFHCDSQVNKYIFKPLHGCILRIYTNWSSLLGENERRGE